jgi:hypothetical protein
VRFFTHLVGGVDWKTGGRTGFCRNKIWKRRFFVQDWRLRGFSRSFGITAVMLAQLMRFSCCFQALVVSAAHVSDWMRISIGISLYKVA